MPLLCVVAYCGALAYAMALRICYALPRICYALPGICYALPGTDVARTALLRAGEGCVHVATRGPPPQVFPATSLRAPPLSPYALPRYHPTPFPAITLRPSPLSPYALPRYHPTRFLCRLRY
eukprot:2063889-Rhodomonas_salina.6